MSNDICRIIWKNAESRTYRLYNFTKSVYADINEQQIGQYRLRDEAEAFEGYLRNAEQFRKMLGEAENLFKWDLVIPVSKVPASKNLAVAIVREGIVKRICSAGYSYKDTAQIFGAKYGNLICSQDVKAVDTNWKNRYGLAYVIRYGCVVAGIVSNEYFDKSVLDEKQRNFINNIIQTIGKPRDLCLRDEQDKINGALCSMYKNLDSLRETLNQCMDKLRAGESFEPLQIMEMNYCISDICRLTRQAHKELRAFAEKKMEPEAVEDMFLFEDEVLNTGSIRLNL